MVYINSDQNKSTGWEGFDYVINMGVTSATVTTVKKRVGSSWTTVGSASYSVVGNQMEISVSRTLLEYTSTDVAYYFQLVDNPQTLDNIEDNFVNGESAPDRRFNYAYSNSKVYESVITSLDEMDKTTTQYQLNIYPNPAYKELIVSYLGSNILIKIELRNVYGQLVYTSVSYEKEHHISVTDFPSGVYLIQIGEESFKVVIQK
jgi:hypothetical protein